MLGNIALRGAGGVDDALHADLLLADDAQYLQPQRVGNRFQRPRGDLDVFVMFGQVGDCRAFHASFRCGGGMRIRTGCRTGRRYHT